MRLFYNLGINSLNLSKVNQKIPKDITLIRCYSKLINPIDMINSIGINIDKQDSPTTNVVNMINSQEIKIDKQNSPTIV